MKRLIIILSFLLVSFNAYAWDKFDYVTYFGTTDKEITVRWDPDPVFVNYEIQLLHVERDSIVTVADSKINVNQKTFKLPRSGHFVPRIRTCTSGYTECSAWSESTNPEVASVDGQPRAWWIYGFVAPPGPIIIGGGDR